MKLTLQQIRNNGYCTLGCQFGNSSKVYTYLSPSLYDLGSLVVVKTGMEYKVVTVVKHNPPAPNPDKIKYRWIVGPVDSSLYLKVKDIDLVADCE